MMGFTWRAWRGVDEFGDVSADTIRFAVNFVKIKAMAHAICLGILVADVIGRPIARVPAPGALELVESITPHLGGCAANTGIGLQRLGVQTAVAGAVGRDAFGEFARTTLNSEGVNTRGVIEKDAPTSATMVLVAPDGERAFLHCVGANAAFGAADFDAQTLRETDLLHIAGHGLMPAFDGAPCAEILRLAKQNGVLTSLDTAGAPDEIWRENLRQTLPHLDYFVPSLHEVRELFPDCATPETLAARLIDAGVETVALKMGERGSYALNRRGQSARAPIYSTQVVDATGAGDAFAAGFLAASLRDLPLQRCLEIGNAYGALCVSAVGTIAGLGDWMQTLKLVD